MQLRRVEILWTFFPGADEFEPGRRIGSVVLFHCWSVPVGFLGVG